MYEVIRWSGRSNTRPRTIYTGYDKDQAVFVYNKNVKSMRQGFVKMYEYGQCVASEMAFRNRTRW